MLAAADLALRLAEPKKAGLTVNPARIDGGGPNNVVPDKAVLRVNMRPRTPALQAAAQAALDEAVAAVAAKHDVRIHVHGGFARPPKPIDARAQKLFELVKRAGADLGQEIGWRDTRRGLRRQQYRRLRRAGGRHDGRARRRHPFGSGISDRREPGRARAIVGAHDPAPRQRGGFVSFRVRPARNEDFQAIYEMAKLTGGGFTNLPADKGTLVAKLARSEDAFARRGRSGRRSVRLRAGECRDRADPRHLPDVQPGRHGRALLFLPDQHDDPDLARARQDLPRRDADALHRFRGQLGSRRPLPPPQRARRRPRRAARAQPLSVHQAPPRALRRPGAGGACAA